MTAGAGERARELAQKVVRDLLGTDDYESEETMQHVTARLAAGRCPAGGYERALREDCVKLMTKWRRHGKAQDKSGLAFVVDGKDFRDCANDLEVALERAGGERAVEGK